MDKEQAVAIAEIEALGGTVEFDEMYPGRPGIQVSFNFSQVTDAGPGLLRELPRLRGLDLKGTQVTDAGVEEMQRRLPNTSIYPMIGEPN